MVELDSNFEFTLAFGSLAPTSTTSTITTTSITSKLTNVFKKGIKRDPIPFLVLKKIINRILRGGI